MHNIIANAKFYSILMDGSTDVSNIDEEMFLVLWSDTDGNDEKVNSRMQFFSVMRPESVNATGLFDCPQKALQQFGASVINAENCKRLIGIGTDGVSANVAAAGLKGLLENKISWVLWMWCLAHQVELALKDALKHTAFGLVEDMLTRLYYIYEKSPKKCCELEEVISGLQQCVVFDDAGTKTIRASGSRWVLHKLDAMKCVLTKYGAYTSHLIALTTDVSVKDADCAKLRGYINKWIDAKYLLGCAFFVDLLSPCAIFSKVLQEDDIDVLEAFTSLLRTVKDVNKLSDKPMEHWKTYSTTVKKITTASSGGKAEDIYQCQGLRIL